MIALILIAAVCVAAFAAHQVPPRWARGMVAVGSVAFGGLATAAAMLA